MTQANCDAEPRSEIEARLYQEDYERVGDFTPDYRALIHCAAASDG